MLLAGALRRSPASHRAQSDARPLELGAHARRLPDYQRRPGVLAILAWFRDRARERRQLAIRGAEGQARWAIRMYRPEDERQERRQRASTEHHRHARNGVALIGRRSERDAQLDETCRADRARSVAADSRQRGRDRSREEERDSPEGRG